VGVLRQTGFCSASSPRQHELEQNPITSAGRADMTEPISPAVQRIIEAACYAP